MTAGEPPQQGHPPGLIEALLQVAKTIRLDVLDMVYRAQSGHIGGAFSAAEILAVLYFHHLRIDPAAPHWPARDRFLLSKGHASAALYSALAHRGFLAQSELMGFRALNSRLQGHPDLKVPGVEIVAGPLGHGVAIGAGMALGLTRQMASSTSRRGGIGSATEPEVVVLIGDGEMNAGVVWEGAMFAAKHRLSNLVCVVDVNGIQQTGSTADIMPMPRLTERWTSFGWTAQTIDGHDVRQILESLTRARDAREPAVILARTTKGRGVSFMEGRYQWHGKAPDADEYRRARAELIEGSAQCPR